ncbi:large ribosomal subunit protein bL36m [Carettochelys insculpta]|uniref:large ribosomal subunit protein bL36m n=1 Tax=Carettochelys insculpta TaxID=44489 RepID=UPI003EBCA0D1
MAALLARTLLAAAAAPLLHLRRGAAPRLPFSLGFGHFLATAPLKRSPAGPALLAPSQLPVVQTVMGIKSRGVIKRRCKDCFVVRRRGRLYVYCKTHPRHKQRLF